MQKLIVLGIIVMMIAGLSVAANAAFTGVQFKLQAENPTGGGFLPITVGWGDGATITTDGKDTAWDATVALATSEDNVELTVINPIISGTGRVNYDYRAIPTTLPALPGPEVWSVQAKVPLYSDDSANAALDFSMGVHAWFTPGFTLPTGYKFLVLNGTWTAATYKTPAGVAATIGSVGAGVSGSFGSPNLNSGVNYTIPFAGTHMFTVVAEVVPEPGSLLALFSGVIGLVGFGIRRRR